MNFLRNPEIRGSLWLYLAAGTVFCGAGYFMQPRFGALMAAACLSFALLHYVLTYRRYRSLQQLAREIDHILYDCSRFDLSRFAEGELSILHSEIYKMTVRLREQADALKKDKVYLADSIADISHQIRTPLTSIHLLLSFLAEEDLPQERRMQLCREVNGLLNRIDWLIAALLKISRLDAGTVQMEQRPVRVADVVRQAAQTVAISMELKGQTLLAEEVREETFLGDSAWTAEAVGNIFKNCMEHTPEEGSITVRAKETGVFTQIEISDSGSGIVPEDIPHLFERFYRGKNAGEGSIGIGLALAKSIMTAQGGTIKAANGHGGGAVFTMRFYKSTV